MKKFITVVLALAMLLSLAACAKSSEKAMTYAEYMEADLDSQVTVDCYVQAHQSWWDGKITVYAADKDGAYFLYNMACSEADAKLFDKVGQGIRVTGYKSEWSGEVEIIDATYTLLKDTYVAKALDVTGLLGSDALIAHQNELVSFTGSRIVAMSFCEPRS